MGGGATTRVPNTNFFGGIGLDTTMAERGKRWGEGATTIMPDPMVPSCNGYGQRKGREALGQWRHDTNAEPMFSWLEPQLPRQRVRRVSATGP